jgi:FecR-like protein
MKSGWSRPALLATTLAFVLMTTGVIAVFFATPAEAHSSTVTVLDGSVLVRHAGGQFAPITDGDVVATGDTVHTAAGSHGVLTLFDGTTVELEPDTEITIDNLQANAAGDKIVAITQAIGRTWHVVTKLVSSTSKYEIRTPASTAEVRGTAFEVVVLPDGTATTATTEGDVATIAQGAEVHVLPGQFTSVTRGSPPPPPQVSPAPAATVQLILDLTSNAIVTDPNGRAVGVLKGQPVRYIPGSKVEVVDGKLVITIPNVQLGLLTTYIQPDPAPLGGVAPTTVTIQTQVSVRGVGIVASSLTSSPLVNGIAKGAVVVTDRGLLLVPNHDAQNAPPPHIGKAPRAPTGILGVRTAPTVAPIVHVAPATAAVTTIPATRPLSAPLDLTTAAFLPYQTTPTTTAPLVNTGVVAITTPLAPLFTTTTTTPTAGGGATPKPAPPFTLPPSLLTSPSATGPGRLPTTVFATPTPSVLPPVIVVPPIAPLPTTPPSRTPPPAVPSIVTASPPVIVVPLPTPPTIIVTPPPVNLVPTAAPTAAPTVAPVVPTVAPATLVPTSAPATPVPSSAPPTPVPSTKKICIIPLLGC